MNPNYIYRVLILLYCVSVINMPFYHKFIFMVIRSLTFSVASGISTHDNPGKRCPEL
jgi:hypothetical protein